MLSQNDLARTTIDLHCRVAALTTDCRRRGAHSPDGHRHPSPDLNASAFDPRSTTDDFRPNIVHAPPEAHDAHVQPPRFDNRDVR